MNITTDAGLISECMEVLEKMDGTALESGFNAWAYVGFNNKEIILKSLNSRYQGIPSPVEVKEPNSGFGAPDTPSLQNPVSCQLPVKDATTFCFLLQKLIAQIVVVEASWYLGCS